MDDENEEHHRNVQAATREVFKEYPQTCQDVADVLGVLAERYGITEGDIEFTRKLIARLATSRLRDGLIKATARAISGERSRDFFTIRMNALQQYQKNLPEPYRAEICNILANGTPHAVKPST